MLNLFCSIIFLVYLWDNTQDPQRKYWKEGKLNVNDFKGFPPDDAKSNNKATICHSFRFITVNGKWKMENFMIKNESWIREEKLNTSDTLKILEHEQLHFDIAELWARKENRIIQNTPDYKKKSFWEVRFYQQEKMQNEFDAHCLFGSDQEAQTIWKIKIKKELDELSEFK